MKIALSVFGATIVGTVISGDSLCSDSPRAAPYALLLETRSRLPRPARRASRAVGKQRVAWRYDPVLLTDKYTVDVHSETFEYMAARLRA